MPYYIYWRTVMWDLLNQQFQERTVGLIFLAAVIGGVVGASLKLIFEVVLADRYRHAQNAKMIIDKYRNPIVRSADMLRGRLVNILMTADTNWYTDSEYYRLSTYYVFCVYFAWIHLLFGNLLRLRYNTSRRNRKLNLLVIAVDKAFNNRTYFSLGPYSAQSPNTAELPKFLCQALGELTVNEGPGNDPSCFTFSQFCRQ